MLEAANRSPEGAGTIRADGGLTLPELALCVALLGVLLAVALPTFGWLDRFALDRAARLAGAHLTRARMSAVARRETLRVRVAPDGLLVLFDAGGRRLAATPLAGEGPFRPDSVRLRPTTLRYNPRGQASAGSLYLYKGSRGVRLVSNFVGRVRRVPLPP